MPVTTSLELNKLETKLGSRGEVKSICDSSIKPGLPKNHNSQWVRNKNSFTERNNRNTCLSCPWLWIRGKKNNRNLPWEFLLINLPNLQTSHYPYRQNNLSSNFHFNRSQVGSEFRNAAKERGTHLKPGFKEFSQIKFQETLAHDLNTEGNKPVRAWSPRHTNYKIRQVIL